MSTANSSPRSCWQCLFLVPTSLSGLTSELPPPARRPAVPPPGAHAPVTSAPSSGPTWTPNSFGSMHQGGPPIPYTDPRDIRGRVRPPPPERDAVTTTRKVSVALKQQSKAVPKPAAAQRVPCIRDEGRRKKGEQNMLPLPELGPSSSRSQDTPSEPLKEDFCH